MTLETHDLARHVGILGFLFLLVAMSAAFAYYGKRFNKVCCATCGDKLRERDSIEHGGDPCKYTHYGICADKYAKVHVSMYYGDAQAINYKQRLLNVARALREGPNPDQFDMGDVIYSCGTPGCAFGYYVSRTDLQDAFKPIQIEEDGEISWTSAWAESGKHVGYYDPEVAEHFGIDADEQFKLFEADGCGRARTAIEAAEFIERFAAKKWPETAKSTR